MNERGKEGMKDESKLASRQAEKNKRQNKARQNK